MVRRMSHSVGILAVILAVLAATSSHAQARGGGGHGGGGHGGGHGVGGHGIGGHGLGGHGLGGHGVGGHGIGGHGLGGHGLGGSTAVHHPGPSRHLHPGRNPWGRSVGVYAPGGYGYGGYGYLGGGYVPPVSAYGNYSPASGGAGARIINPGGLGMNVAYAADGQGYQLATGEEQSLPSGTIVQFSRGGNLGLATYTLDDGAYEFALSSDGGLDLVAAN